jgi:hypothetical protein
MCCSVLVGNNRKEIMKELTGKLKEVYCFQRIFKIIPHQLVACFYTLGLVLHILAGEPAF